eukprot:980655_1
MDEKSEGPRQKMFRDIRKRRLDTHGQEKEKSTTYTQQQSDNAQESPDKMRSRKSLLAQTDDEQQIETLDADKVGVDNGDEEVQKNTKVQSLLGTQFTDNISEQSTAEPNDTEPADTVEKKYPSTKLKHRDIVIDMPPDDADQQLQTDSGNGSTKPTDYLKFGAIGLVVIAVLLIILKFFVPQPDDLVETMTKASAKFTDESAAHIHPESVAPEDQGDIIMIVAIAGGAVAALLGLGGAFYWAFTRGYMSALDRHLPALVEKTRRMFNRGDRDDHISSA